MTLSLAAQTILWVQCLAKIFKLLGVFPVLLHYDLDIKMIFIPFDLPSDVTFDCETIVKNQTTWGFTSPISLYLWRVTFFAATSVWPESNYYFEYLVILPHAVWWTSSIFSHFFSVAALPKSPILWSTWLEMASSVASLKVSYLVALEYNLSGCYEFLSKFKHLFDMAINNKIPPFQFGLFWLKSESVFWRMHKSPQTFQKETWNGGYCVVIQSDLRASFNPQTLPLSIITQMS